jgi:hypothetical protein
VQWRLAARRPVAAVARRPGPEPARNLLDEIRSRWSGWGLGPAPERLLRTLWTGSLDERGKVVALLSTPGDGRPRVAVKSARTREAALGLEREASALAALPELAGGEIAGVPRLLMWSPEHGAAVETALDGIELSGFLRGRAFRDVARQATDWLVELARRTRVPPAADWKARLLDRGAWRDAEAILETLEPLPVVCEQRDFSPWNVRIDVRGQLVVFDWESAELSGFPALDLIYFLTYASLYRENAMRAGGYRPFTLAAFRRSLNPESRTGAVSEECLTRYAEATGLPRKALRPLRLLAWMLHGRSAWTRLREQGGSIPDPEQLRRHVFWKLWEEQLRELANA